MPNGLANYLLLKGLLFIVNDFDNLDNGSNGMLCNVSNLYWPN